MHASCRPHQIRFYEPRLLLTKPHTRVQLEFRSKPGQPVEESRRIIRRSVQKNVQEAIANVSITIRRKPDSDYGCQVSGGIAASVSPVDAPPGSSGDNKVVSASRSGVHRQRTVTVQHSKNDCRSIGERTRTAACAITLVPGSQSSSSCNAVS